MAIAMGQLNSANARITDYVLSFDSEGLSIPSYTFSTVTVTVPVGVPDPGESTVTVHWTGPLPAGLTTQRDPS